MDWHEMLERLRAVQNQEPFVKPPTVKYDKPDDRFKLVDKPPPKVEDKPAPKGMAAIQLEVSRRQAINDLLTGFGVGSC